MLCLVIAGSVNAASTGKISGHVIDKETNAPLMGANIVIEGTSLGAAVDVNGDYVILNIPPGEYSVKATMMGYAILIQEHVWVSINLTTTLNFEMQEEAVAGETVTITAERPAVQMDITSSQLVINAEDIQARPLENIEEILAAEVGISLEASPDGTGLIVRGGELNETDIIVDGLSTRNERNAQPLTTLNISAIKEVEILIGGFSAEYGNIRSGMISVVTDEGSLDRYSLNLDTRLSPSARKHFGPSPFGIEGPFWQVYTGSDAFTGVTQAMVDNGNYPFTFVGWNEIARQNLLDPDPSNDLTPQALLELWKWQHRMRKYADKPDYIVDGSFSGKLPFVPVAFMISQRYEDLQLAYPFSRNNSTASSTLLKLTSHITPNMKLSLTNNYIIKQAVSGSIYSNTTGLIDGSRIGTEYARNAITDITSYRYIWHDANFNPADIHQLRSALSLNHVLSPRTFYDVCLEFTSYRITQEPIRARDPSLIKEIGGQWYDEQPFGYVGGENIIEQYDILGDFLMSGGGRGQDHSRYWGISLSANIVSQVNKHNEIKTGFDLDYTSFEERTEINHGQTTQPYEEAPWNWTYYDKSPVRLGAYIKDKLEFQGVIADIGIRVDYMKAGITPYNLDPDFIFTNLPYTYLNFQEGGNSFEQYTTDQKDYKLYVSPRLGVSHPVTSTSKIFFNYGHFYQPPIMSQLYTVQPYARGATLPNVGVEWPRTVSYSIGYEQSVGRDFLIHFMGYYKDVSDQLRQQDIVAIDSENDVTTWANNEYRDIRGLELKLEKRTGQWWYGWINVEYMSQSTGYTGSRYIYEDRQLARLEREETAVEKPAAVPSVNANLTFKTPVRFGPEIMGIRPLGDWRFNILQEWSDGGQELLNSDAPLNEQIYVETIDWWNTDVLLEKRFYIGIVRLGVFVQVKNLFNYKGWPAPLNWNKYVDSLHFPHETGNQKGNDKLGDWDKDYIELGWNTWSHFINPRDIYFGLRFQF